jgi:uncharacterized protein YdaU (DUF1376 family)
METEQPIPNETQQVIRRLRLGSSGLILESILTEFFTLEDDNCWHNSRCDAEIKAYKRLAEVSRINGKLGGRPKKTQQVILANPAGTQQEPSGLQPRTKNQEPSSSISHEKIVFDGIKFQNINGHLKAWEAAYPALNIEVELSKAAAWILSNPKNTKKQWARFINGWLSRAQDKAPRVINSQSSISVPYI